MRKSTVRRLVPFATLLAVVTFVISPTPGVLGGQSGALRAMVDGHPIPLAEVSSLSCHDLAYPLIRRDASAGDRAGGTENHGVGDVVSRRGLRRSGVRRRLQLAGSRHDQLESSNQLVPLLQRGQPALVLPPQLRGRGVHFLGGERPGQLRRGDLQRPVRKRHGSVRSAPAGRGRCAIPKRVAYA
jgi:hypothetical protein